MSAPVPEHERRLSLALRGCDHDSSPIRVLPEDVRACLQEVKGLRQSHVATNFIERTDRIAAIAAQRRMIAALYWRAGDAEVIGRAYHRAGGRGSMVTARSWLEASSALAHAARVMEATCPR